MDTSKMSAVLEWPTPQSIRDIQSFLGLANFYHRFIKNYSLLAVPLTHQLKKDHQFCWAPEPQSAFESLKQAFTTAPVLQMFDPTQSCIMETDASDFAIAGVLSQRSNDDLLHPIAFYCRKRKSAELNYDIYDKEMLTIVDWFKHCCQYLEGSSLQSPIYIDHRKPEHFMPVKQLNHRQAR